MKRLLFVLVLVCVVAVGFSAPASAQLVLPGRDGTAAAAAPLPSRAKPPLGRDFVLAFAALSFAASGGAVLASRRRLA